MNIDPENSSPCRLASWLSWVVFAVGLILGAGVHAAEADYEEPPPVVLAGDLVPSAVLAGPHHRVDDLVVTDGFLTHFTIRSEFGDFDAVGPGMLQERVREIEALAALRELAQEDELKAGMERSAREKAGSLKHFIDEPKETLQAIPDGVGRFFKRTYRSTKTGIQKLQDVREGRAPGSPAADGPGSRLPGGVSADNQPSSQQSVSKAAARAAGDITVNALGFDDSRRRLAKRLGVDPYTTNRVLAEKMDEVAWAAFAGDLGVDLLTAMIPGGAFVTTSTRLADWVWDTPPGDLVLDIEGLLRRMGADQDSIDRLLRHRWYTLTLRAALTSALASLSGVAGRPDVMPLALTVASEEQARYLVGTLSMIARFHEAVKPVRELRVLGTVTAVTVDDEVVVAAPVDFLSWNQGVDRFSRQQELAGPDRSIYLAGRLTESAREYLEARSWTLHENSPLFAPPVSATGR